MRAFELHVEFPTGTILVGGHSALPSGTSMAHAKDRDGRPMIPATALRGALRENLEAILRGNNLGACDAGTGYAPGQLTADEHSPCKLGGGERCICCRLFGSRDKALPQGARVFSSLMIGDAALEGEDGVRWSDRQHVSISRTHRSAESRRLFLRRTPQLHGRRLVARGYTVEEEFNKYLEAAVRATTHLGSGRSIGLARVDLKLHWREDIELDTGQAPSLEHEDVDIRVTLKSPTMLGGPLLGDNFRMTRRELPGSVLRGALGFAIARTLPDPDGDDAFRTLVDEHEGSHFGFLYPKGRTLPGPWPLTARACKAHPHTHGIVDTLFDRIAVACIERRAQVAPVQKVILVACSSQGCHSPLRSARGTRGATNTPSTRVITRVSIERRRSSARQGALFSYELLDPGTVFEGSIRNVPKGSRALLHNAVQLPVHVGRGASSGWGRVEIECTPKKHPPALSERGEQFVSALTSHFRAAQLPTQNLHHILPITFLAPLLPVDNDDGRATLAGALGEVFDSWLVVARRFARDGGWDQRLGRPTPELAVAGGSVYVARLKCAWNDKLFLKTLRELEKTGFGRRRHQGYGHAIFFDPFILTRKQVAMNRSEHSTHLRPFRRDLVLAAERVIHDAFKGGQRTKPPAKTQFSRLVNICGEASCAEEIVNYLRYQAGREVKSSGNTPTGDVWRVDFVNAIIAGVADVLGQLLNDADNEKVSQADKDRRSVEAWQLYATYLTRAFTYEDAVRRSR